MISIIVPVYNVRQYLNECLQSIVNQTYQNCEIILVDDGSTDGSGELCDEWAAEYKNIRVLHKENGGLSSARNAGLDIASGEYVVFIDSDDYIDKDMFNSMRACFDESEVDMVICCLETFSEVNQSKKLFLPPPVDGLVSSFDYIRLILRHQADNAVCNKMFRRKALASQRFIFGKINEDILFLVPYLLNASNCFIIRKGYYKYRIRSGSITQQANPRLYDFVENAFWVKSRLNEIYGNRLEAESDGYIYHEMINFISTVQKFDAKERFQEQINQCLSYIRLNVFDFITNNSCCLSHKLKLVFVLTCPGIYRVLLRHK